MSYISRFRLTLPLLTFLVLLGSLTSCNGPAPKTRLSWQEQLLLVQRAVSAEDPKAVLYDISAVVAFDEKRASDMPDQTIPFPVIVTGLSFLNSDGETLRLNYYDVLVTDTLPLDNMGHRPYMRQIDSKIDLTQLPMMVSVGPLEACLSTFEMAQQTIGSQPAYMRCGALLDPYGPWSKEFNVPAVWSIDWTSYQKDKKNDFFHIWINAETGERLRIKKNGVDIEPTS